MTPDEQKDEGSEEPVEDLEAPAEAQEDVAGGSLREADEFLRTSVVRGHEDRLHPPVSPGSRAPSVAADNRHENRSTAT